MPDLLKKIMKDLIFTLPESLGLLVFEGSILEKMLAHRQTSFFSREAGGQLFAEIGGGVIRVVDATEPNKKDRRSRFAFWPHRPTEQIEIHKRFVEKKIHFVGDWHTHPEKVPHPSGSDAESVKRIMNESHHDMLGILLVIVGTADIPDGLFVGFQTKTELHILYPKLDGC